MTRVDSWFSTPHVYLGAHVYSFLKKFPARTFIRGARLFGTQEYTLKNLEKHTNYVVTVSARNYVGLGPAAVIELRTEDGGKQ